MKRNLPIIIVVLVLALISLFILFTQSQTKEDEGSVSNQTDSEIRARVVEFGSKLKNVSLLMSPTDIRGQMQTHYAEYLTPELLVAWQNDPAQALGRSVSSPWPERLDVVAVSKIADKEYQVEGNVIEFANFSTTTQPVAVYPVNLIVEQRSDTWLISKLEKGAYSELPKRITISGLWECLPHKNTEGPQTMECAFGLAVDQSDAHYALDLNLLSTSPIDYPMGTHLQVEGLMVPANQLNSNMWQIYPIDGIISVTSIKKI